MREGRNGVPMESIWAYPAGSGHTEGQDLTGCAVAAADGTIGHVDREAEHFGMRHLVVDTGVWVFGRSVLVPVGVVTGIDTGARSVTVACTRAEVKAAPRFRTDSETMDRDYLASVGDYYHRLPPRDTSAE
ncbi:PRC-barrel domain containing protein [Streptomyces rochei]